MPRSLLEWLSYIESLHSRIIELGLERIKQVATRLDIFPDPKKVKVFTIAGTNGKGSCTAFLESILESADYLTAVYTSPHLLRFNERIRINRVEVSDTLLIEAFEKVEKARFNVHLTYFEFTTLAAFYLFKQSNANVWVLEIGLGGRLDAVNIIDPDIAIITTIAMDHMDWLGETREEIGYEKAGIIRENVPIVCGDPEPPNSIPEIAKTRHAPLYRLNQDFWYKSSTLSWCWKSLKHKYLTLPLTQLPLQNAATILMALELSYLKIDPAAILNGLKSACLKGRFQIFTGPFPIILDVAHNPQSAEYLAQRLGIFPLGRTRAVVGMLKDKDIEQTLLPLFSYVDEWYVASLCVPRGEISENIANYLHKQGVTAYHTNSSVSTAFETAVDHSSTKDRIIVFGSFYTVAEVLQLLEEGHLWNSK